jgi:hypothetical protein
MQKDSFWETSNRETETSPFKLSWMNVLVPRYHPKTNRPHQTSKKNWATRYSLLSNEITWQDRDSGYFNFGNDSLDITMHLSV